MIREKYRQVVISALLSLTVLLTSVHNISIASATPTVTRSLPAGSDVYAMGCYGDYGQLIRILTSSGVPTGAQTRIGVGTTDSRKSNCPRNAAYNPVTQTGYWVSAVGSSPATKQHLFSISSAGVSTYVTEITADTTGRNYAITGGTNILVMYGITFDAAGNMYAMWRSMATDIWIGKVTLNNSSDDGKIVHSSVYKLNISNLQAEQPYNFAFNSVDNKFYTAGSVNRTGQNSPHLYEINIATGGTTDLGQSGDPNALFYGMQFDSNGVIWGGYTKISSATVSDWTVAGNLEQTSFANYGITAVFIAPSLSTAPSAPTLNAVTAGDRSISVAFTAGANGGASITDYEYSLNGGTYVSAATTTSPFTISGLSGRTAYSVTLKARNSVDLGSASSSLSATTTDSSADASEAAAAEAARVAAAEAARVAAVNAAVAAAAAKRAAEQKEMSELLAVLPSIAGLALNIGDLTNSLLVKQKCVNGKKTKTVSYGSKCPTGYVKRK
jgi:hypothetical protein